VAGRLRQQGARPRAGLRAAAAPQGRARARENLLFDLSDDFSRRNYYSTQERLALFLAVQAATNGAAKDDGLEDRAHRRRQGRRLDGTGVGQQSSRWRSSSPASR
jgi:hypothetical protein